MSFDKQNAQAYYSEKNTITILNDTITITFNTNGASTSVPNVGLVSGNSMGDSFPAAPIRQGYTFGGWFTDNGAWQNEVLATTAITGNATLNAKWTANTYSVSYNGNNNTGGSSADSSHTYDIEKKLTANGFTRTGYTFMGWSTASNAATATYTDEQIVSNLTSINNNTVTLYAVWQANTCTVTLNNHGTTSAATATYDSAMPAITVPTRTGYTFGGYFTEANGSGTQYYTAAGASAKACDLTVDTTLYAQWTANGYTVTLNAQGGTGGTASVNATYDSAMPSITAPTHTEYTFGGYYTEQNGGGTQYYDADGASKINTYGIAANTTLYAKWTKGGKTVRTTMLDLTAITESNPLGATYSDGVYTSTNEGWIYVVDADTATAGNQPKLTLNGVTIDTADANALRLPENTTIMLVQGTSNTAKSTNGCGINGQTTIQGERGGTLTASGTAQAFALAPSAENTTAQGSQNTDGSSSVQYESTNNSSYKWAKFIFGPVISVGTQPVNTEVAEGEITGSLTVSARIANPANAGDAPSYQWYSNTTNSSTGGTLLTGKTTSDFAIPTSLSVGKYYYYCVLSGTSCTTVATSVATVTVRHSTPNAAYEGGIISNLIANKTYILTLSDTTTKEITANSEGKYDVRTNASLIGKTVIKITRKGESDALNSAPQTVNWTMPIAKAATPNASVDENAGLITGLTARETYLLTYQLAGESAVEKSITADANGKYDAYADTALVGTTLISLVRPGTVDGNTNTANSDAQTLNKFVKIRITIQWRNLNKVYTGTEQKPDVSAFTGKLGSDDVTVGVTGATDAGSHPVRATLGGTNAGKYVLTNPTATLTIQKAPVTFAVTDNMIAATAASKTATVTASANGAAFTGFAVTYKQNGVTVTPDAAGTYDVYAEISSANYRHSAGTDGSAQKIGVLTVYADAAPATYAVTFGANGGSGTTAALAAAQAGTIRVFPKNSFAAPAGQKFIGWNYGEKIYQPGESFTQPESNVAVTAQWQYDYTISGGVTQNDAPAADAVMTLMKGSEQIAQTVTDATGNYSFDNVAPGLYNLTATKDGVVKTILVEITASSVSGKDMELPTGKTNAVVEVVPGTAAIVVDKMDDLFTATDESVADAGGEVEIKLTATAGSSIDVQTEAASDDATVGLLVDMDVTKTTILANGDQTSVAITETDSLLTVVVELPGAMQGKANYVVYREHNGQVDTLTTTPNNDGEYIEVNDAKTQITIHARKFSVYGIGYSNNFTVSFHANGGSVTPATAITDSEGKLASLPTPTKDGSTFTGWYTQVSGGTMVTADTVFGADTTVYAQWAANNNGFGSGDAGAYFTIVTNAGTGGHFDTGKMVLVPITGSAGFTIIPNKGYVIANVKVDGKSVGAVSYYAFTDVRENHTISATFKRGSRTNPQTGVGYDGTEPISTNASVQHCDAYDDKLKRR